MSKAVQDRNQTTPDWPTMIRSKLTDGRLLGVDNSLWLYRTVPMAPVAEARTPQEGVATSAPIMLAMDELASLTPVRMARRAAARAGYRETHILLVNLPQRFVPPADHPNADYLATSFPNTPTDRRVLLFGVRLASKVGGEGGIRRAVDSVVETLVMGGTPLSDYEPDYQAVSAALARCGLRAPSGEEIRLASAWWNEGNAPDTPMLSQVEALHVFTTAEAARAAKRAGPDADLSDLGAGHHTITFASVSDLDLPFVSPTDPRAHWASQLVDQGALAISVRGKVEPSKVTRGELRRQRKRYIDDMRERAGAGLMDRTEQSEQEQLLAEVEAVYATGGPPTLIETSIVVGFNGYVPDMPELSRDLTATLLPMWYRQRTAMAETMLCSAVRANPHLQDLPSQSIAASGLPSLSSVGDKTGALLGFTESDRQPVWVDAMAATDQDSLPYLLVAGATGSGKTVLMLWLADQMAKLPSKACKGENTPVIIIDPKAVTLDTRIPTPRGWTTMGEIEVGDQVFGRDGQPCNVVRKSRVFTETRLFEFVLDDGQVVRADNNHQWLVASQRDRVKMTADPTHDHWRTVTTEQILAEGVTRGRQTNFALPVTQAVEFPKESHIVPPYVLGAWLGDGVSKTGSIVAGYTDADEMDEILASYWPNLRSRDDRTVREFTLTRAATSCKRGHPAADFVSRARSGAGLGATQMYCRKCVLTEFDDRLVVNPSLHNLLAQEGLLGDKHIPDAYLRGSVEQRMELLRGLMDTDGTVKRSGACRYAGTNRALVAGVLELVRSLGFKAMLHTSVASITEADETRPGSSRRRVTGSVYEVTFRTHLPVFKLRRKLALLPSSTPRRARFHYIKAVTPIESEAAQCVGVDSQDHTFLVAGFIPTHNTGSDHGAAVLEAGGQVASLDDLVSSDGIYDPIRFSANAEVGVELAASMLMSVNPWGSKRDDYEAPLQYALHYGVSRGATCIGQALWTARQEGHADPVMVDAAFRLAQSSAMFRACFGINPTTTGLRVADGITLIKVGNAHLDLPAPGAVNPPLPQRVALALVRMMVYGSAMALADRDGVVMLDEAWVFMSAGREEMERLGRLARAMRVLPVMLTQRVSDAVNAGLSGYISRGLIGHLSDPVEAEAACLAFKLEPTPERMGRIMASDVIGSGDSIAPNFNSLRALVDRNTRQVYRGAVWIHCDTSGRSVPVEVSLPPAFLKRASTNAAEIRARKAVADRTPDGDLEPTAPPVQVKAARALPAPYTQAGFSSDTPFPIPASGGPQPATDLVAASG